MADKPDQPLRIGGMALDNGLLLHGPTHWSAAVRRADGTLAVADGRKPLFDRRGALNGVPIARGVLRMAEATAVLPLVRRALPEAKLPFERPTVLVAAVAAGAASIAVHRSRRVSPLGTELLSTGLALVPALSQLASRRLTRYHGAEHKTIAAYEQGGAAADAAKEHERCGSYLVGPLLVTSVLANAAVRGIAPRSQTARAAAGAVSIGAAVELFGWMLRNRERPLARALRAPGFALQHAVGTREPTTDELDVAQAALERLLECERPTGG